MTENNNNLFQKRLSHLVGKEDLRPFARKCGVDEKSLRKYLQGESEPNLKNLRKIAAANHVSIDWLAGGEELFPKPSAETILPQPATEALRDRDIKGLLAKTVAVLRSEGPLAGALRLNILSSYEAMLDKRDKTALQEQVVWHDEKIRQLEEQLRRFLKTHRKKQDAGGSL